VFNSILRGFQISILRVRVEERIAQDIAERKRTAEEQRSLSLLRATLESTTDGILVVDNQEDSELQSQVYRDVAYSRADHSVAG